MINLHDLNQSPCKGISKIPGVSNVQVTTSGRPNVGSGAFSGGEIFGILFGIAAALFIANFAYKVGFYFFEIEIRTMVFGYPYFMI